MAINPAQNEIFAEHGILRLIQRKCWTQVEKMLSLETGLAMPNLSQTCNKCNCSHSALLHASKHDPPLRIVRALLRANPIAIYETDCDKKLPLHLACEYGASPEVIKTLIHANKEAVHKRDQNGMIPLHYVCRFYSLVFTRRLPKIIANKCLMEVIRSMLHVDLGILLMECDGMDAIEIALDAGMDMNVVQTLQLAKSLSFEKDKKKNQQNL